MFEQREILLPKRRMVQTVTTLTLCAFSMALGVLITSLNPSMCGDLREIAHLQLMQDTLTLENSRLRRKCTLRDRAREARFRHPGPLRPRSAPTRRNRPARSRGRRIRKPTDPTASRGRGASLSRRSRLSHSRAVLQAAGLVRTRAHRCRATFCTVEQCVVPLHLRIALAQVPALTT